MAVVEVRDHALWIKHVHGDEDLSARLRGLSAGALIELAVDGVRGHWKKMADGKDGRPTDGLRALGTARHEWLELQAERGRLVSISDAGAVRTVREPA